MHIYIYIYINTYIHTCIHIYVCRYACIHIYYIYIDREKDMHIYKNVYYLTQVHLSPQPAPCNTSVILVA